MNPVRPLDSREVEEWVAAAAECMYLYMFRGTCTSACRYASTYVRVNGARSSNCLVDAMATLPMTLMRRYIEECAVA